MVSAYDGIHVGVRNEGHWIATDFHGRLEVRRESMANREPVGNPATCDITIPQVPPGDFPEADTMCALPKINESDWKVLQQRRRNRRSGLTEATLTMTDSGTRLRNRFACTCSLGLAMSRTKALWYPRRLALCHVGYMTKLSKATVGRSQKQMKPISTQIRTLPTTV